MGEGEVAWPEGVTEGIGEIEGEVEAEVVGEGEDEGGVVGDRESMEAFAMKRCSRT